MPTKAENQIKVSQATTAAETRQVQICIGRQFHTHSQAAVALFALHVQPPFPLPSFRHCFHVRTSVKSSMPTPTIAAHTELIPSRLPNIQRATVNTSVKNMMISCRVIGPSFSSSSLQAAKTVLCMNKSGHKSLVIYVATMLHSHVLRT
jgi:hypothetical protein